MPCGVREHGVTSLKDLGRDVTMSEVDAALAEVFQRKIDPIQPVAPPAADQATVLRLRAELKVEPFGKEKEPEGAFAP